MPPRTLPALLLAVLCLLAALALPAAAQIPPDARWETLETPHFRVHFTPGLEGLARRAGARAEAAREELAGALVQPPRERIDLVVTDNADFSNGYATPIPSNRVVVYAHPPASELALGFYDDWLDLVITHELVHIFHLDYARGIPRGVRRVLGRHPLAFPNASVPGWITEGLATHLESRLTRAGRVRGTTHEMILRTAVLEDRFFSIDRATGDPASWPGGSTRYVYGSLFIDWLVRRYGHQRTGEWVRRVGGTVVPWALDRHARAVFGVSFTTAWDEWRRELEGRYRLQADSLRRAGLTEPELLTREGREAFHPRWSPDGAWIAYAASTGRDAPSTRLVSADGRDVEALARRSTLEPAAWLPEGRGLLTSQIELRGPYRYFADLYRVGVPGGDVDRLTSGARLQEPDVSRDGRSVVAVRAGGGTTTLVRVELATGEVRELVPPSADVHWSLPRWSPDGTRIAVARWSAGRGTDVVVLDSAGRVVGEATRDRAVDQAPAWSPDGRWVLFSSDRSGIPNLYAWEPATGTLRQVTNVLTGVFQPDVSPDGRWIALVVHRADGYHLARIPFDPARWRDPAPVRAEVAGTGADPQPAPAEGATRRYSPWASLAPRSWSPIFGEDGALGTGVGAAVAQTDIVGRHAYAVSALVYANGGRTDAAVGYAYRGLGNPVLGASAYQDWEDVLAAVPGRSALLERDRVAGVNATLLRPRWLSNTWVSGAVSLRDRQREWDDPAVADSRFRLDFPRDLGAAVTVGANTLQSYAFSISQERGVYATLTAEGRRYLEAFEEGDDPAGYGRLTARTRAFHPLRLGGFARHVVALRAAGAGEHGSRAPGLEVGGTDGGGVALLPGADLGLGDDVDFPLRGYRDGAQSGDRAFGASAEYRFPLALVERGVRVLPAFLDRVWGAAFVDGGAAWCVERCEPDFVGQEEALRPLWSVGAELGTDLQLGYIVGLTLRGGAALPLSRVEVEEGGMERPKPQLYLRLGRSF